MEDLFCWQSKFKSCYYSHRVLQKLALLNQQADQKVNLLEIKKSIYYAKKYHATQKRESGELYYTHPLEVAFMVSDYCFKTDILITSILHDVIEDTALTKAMITHIFGEVIATNVEDLSRVKNNHKVSAAEIVHLLWQQQKKDLLLVKYFDRLDNLKTIQVKSPEKIQKILRETLEEFISLDIYLKGNIPKLFNSTESMINLCYKQLAIKPLLGFDSLNLAADNYELPYLFLLQ